MTGGTTGERLRRARDGGALTVAFLAVAQAAANIATTNRYGIGLETYMIATGARLSWGYVDFTPLGPAVQHVTVELLGRSNLAIHAPSILLGAALVVLAAQMVRELGGQRWARTTVALMATIGPVFLGVSWQFSPTTLEIVLRSAAMAAVFRLIRTRDRRLWLLHGVLAALEILAKPTAVIWIGATLVSIIVFAPPALTRCREFAYGIAITAALVSPSVAWYLTHWPETSRIIDSGADVSAGRIAQLVLATTISATPVAAWIAVEGAVASWRSDRSNGLRFLGRTGPIGAALIIAGGAAPIYAVPMVLPFAALGATHLESRLGPSGRRTTVAMIALTGLLALPLAWPVLSEATLKSSGVGAVFNLNARLGHRAMVDDIAEAYRSLEPSARARTTILAATVAEAAGIEFWGPALGLPRAISPDNSYGHWGFGDAADTEPVLLVGFDANTAAVHFAGCHTIGHLGQGGEPMDPNEQGRAIRWCDHPTAPWAVIWPALRSYGRQ